MVKVTLKRGETWTLQMSGIGWFFIHWFTQAIFQAPLTLSFSHIHFPQQEPIQLRTQAHRGGSCPRSFAQRQQSGADRAGSGIWRVHCSLIPPHSHSLGLIPPAHQLAVSKAASSLLLRAIPQPQSVSSSTSSFINPERGPFSSQSPQPGEFIVLCVPLLPSFQQSRGITG